MGSAGVPHREGAAKAPHDPAVELSRGATESFGATESEPARVTEPVRLSFDRQPISVSEGDGAVAVVIRRLGESRSRVPLVWWTADGTAVRDEDYAELGVRSETLENDELERTIFIPLVADSQPEVVEKFYVIVSQSVGHGESSKPTTRLEILVTDDD
jgi:hypothetical protein